MEKIPDKATLKRMGIRPKNRIWHTFKSWKEILEWIDMLDDLRPSLKPFTGRDYGVAQELMDIRADIKALHFKDLPCCLPPDTCNACNNHTFGPEDR